MLWNKNRILFHSHKKLFLSRRRVTDKKSRDALFELRRNWSAEQEVRAPLESSCALNPPTQFHGDSSSRSVLVARGPGLQCASLQGRALRVGVQYEVAPELTRQAFNATFEQYLTDFLEQFGCEGGVTMQLLNASVINEVVQHAVAQPQQAQVDLLFASPDLTAAFASMSNQVMLLGTIRQVYGNIVTDQVGGVLVRHPDRHEGLVSWDDLRDSSTTEDLRLCALGSDSFDSFLIQEVEAMDRVGKKLADIFSGGITHLPSHDNMLDQLLSQGCDVAAVSMGVFQRFSNSASLVTTVQPSSQTWFVIGAEASQGETLLPTHSTKLYPQWGVAGLSHVPQRLLQLIQSKLVSLDDHTPAALAGHHAGFVFPLDYSEALLVDYHINFWGDGRCPVGYERDRSPPNLCRPCPMGYFSNSQLLPCQPCPPKFYTNKTGATACLMCGKGYSTFSEGSTSCVAYEEEIFKAMQTCANYPNSTIVFGVLQTDDLADMRALWAPTFEDTLNDFLERYHCACRMEVFSWDSFVAAVASNAIQFGFMDAGLYAVLEYHYQTKALATVLHRYQGSATANDGGVIFRMAGDGKTFTTLRELASFASQEHKLTLCAVDEHSFLGYQAEWYEFFKQGLDIREVFTIKFTQSHEASVRQLVDGECEVGMAQANTLEEFSLKYNYDLSNFVIINEQSPPNFHAKISTALYNQWPVAVMRNVPQEIAQMVLLPLLHLEEEDPSAVAGNHLGFKPQPNFEAEAHALYQLNLMDPITQACAPGYGRDTTQSLAPCRPCQSGYFSSNGIGSCEPCSPGFANAETGQASCKLCPVGTNTYDFGAQICLKEGQTLYDPIEACAQYPNNTLTVGMLLSEQTEELTLRRWKPTFEDTLNTYLNRYQCYFRLQVMGYHELWSALERREVQFLFADSGFYTKLNYKFRAQAVATIVRFYDGRPYKQRGGILIRRKDRHQDILTLADITRDKNLTACPPSEMSFAGYTALRYEFFKQNIDVQEVFAKIQFSGSHDATVDMVAREECDIGFAGTYSLRFRINAGDYSANFFQLVNDQFHPGFNLQVSTALYNEWALAVAEHVDEDIWSQAIIPLLGMREYDQASMRGKHAGFIPAGDFSAEEFVNYQLDLMSPDSHNCKAGWARNYSHKLQPCEPCAAGKEGPDGLSCTLCSPGFAAQASGTARCSRCQVGFTTLSEGASECVAMGDTLKFKAMLDNCALFDNRTLKVGVVWENSVALARQRWQPTFEGVLNDYFNRYSCYFQMVPLAFGDTEKAIVDKSVDFVFLNSGSFVKFSLKYNLKALSSVLRIFAGITSRSYGGVIFHRADRLSEVSTLQDLATSPGRLVACSASKESFAGWEVQMYEFFKVELWGEDLFARIDYGTSHDAVVKMVHDGKCDVGFIRTETLERLARDGVYELEEFKLINQKFHKDFYQLISTDLYPEWPFASLPHVPKEITDVVSIPLLALREWDTASIAGSHSGFTTVLNYDSVAAVCYQLNLAGDGTCGPGNYRNFASKMQGCAICPPGSVSIAGKGPCSPCPKNWISPLAGGSACQSCPFGLYTFGQVVLAIYFIVDPPFYEDLALTAKGQDFFTLVHACHVSKVFVPLIFGLYVILLVGQSWLAFRVRNLPTIFNESQLIAWLLYNTVFVGLVGIVIDAVLEKQAATARMMVRSVALLLGSITPVCVLYIPKLLEIYRDQKNNSKYSSKDTNSTNDRTATSNVNPTKMRSGSKQPPLSKQRPGDGHSAAWNLSVVETAGKGAGKSSHCNGSALSGVSDAGDAEDLHDFHVEFIPSSDIAGDEGFHCQTPVMPVILGRTILHAPVWTPEPDSDSASPSTTGKRASRSSLTDNQAMTMATGMALATASSHSPTQAQRSIMATRMSLATASHSPTQAQRSIMATRMSLATASSHSPTQAQRSIMATGKALATASSHSPIQAQRSIMATGMALATASSHSPTKAQRSISSGTDCNHNGIHFAPTHAQRSQSNHESEHHGPGIPRNAKAERSKSNGPARKQELSSELKAGPELPRRAHAERSRSNGPARAELSDLQAGAHGHSDVPRRTHAQRSRSNGPHARAAQLQFHALNILLEAGEDSDSVTRSKTARNRSSNHAHHPKLHNAPAHMPTFESGRSAAVLDVDDSSDETEEFVQSQLAIV
eukprot:g56491.t1